FASSIIDSIYKFSGDDNLFYSESLRRLKLYLNTMDFVYFSSNLPFSQRDSVLSDYKKRLIDEHELNPSFAHMTLALSAVYSKLGYIDSSIYFLNNTIEKSPTWLYPRYLLIKKYKETGQNEKAFEVLNSVLDLDSLYKCYECLSCFFEEAHLLIEDSRDPINSDHLYRDLLEIDLLSKEKSQILFYKYLNANRYLSTFSRVLNYQQLKKQIGNSFCDRMILLTTDVIEEKMFVRDKKIEKLLGLMDSLAASKDLDNYFSNPRKLPDLLTKSENKFFFKYFPQGMYITDYSFEEYLVFKSYILFILKKF
ncbi:MAG: tetratricopeptide repeat protein, partial [Bacteroidota bacterium]